MLGSGVNDDMSDCSRSFCFLSLLESPSFLELCLQVVVLLLLSNHLLHLVLLLDVLGLLLSLERLLCHLFFSLLVLFSLSLNGFPLSMLLHIRNLCDLLIVLRLGSRFLLLQQLSLQFSSLLGFLLVFVLDSLHDTMLLVLGLIIDLMMLSLLMLSLNRLSWRRALHLRLVLDNLIFRRLGLLLYRCLEDFFLVETRVRLLLFLYAGVRELLDWCIFSGQV